MSKGGHLPSERILWALCQDPFIFVTVKTEWTSPHTSGPDGLCLAAGVLFTTMWQAGRPEELALLPGIPKTIVEGRWVSIHLSLFSYI